MMEGLKEAARMLNCRIYSESANFIPGGHIAVITDSGIHVTHRCNGPILPCGEMLFLSVSPIIAAQAYAKLKIPTWIYFQERKLKNLRLPPLPKAQRVILALNSDDYAIDIMHRVEDRWMVEDRYITPFPDMNEEDIQFVIDNYR